MFVNSACKKPEYTEVDKEKAVPVEISTVKILSENGIILRENHNRKSKKIDAIPWGTEIELLDENGPFEIINETCGYWIKVKFGEKTGWIFGGYVAKKIGNDYVRLTNNIDVFIEMGFNLGIEWESTKKNIIDKIGKPIKIDTKSYVSSQNNKEYPAHQLKYPDYKIEVVEVYKKSFVTSIEVNRKKHTLMFDIQIGDRINDLIKLIGEPTEIVKSEIEGKAYKIFEFIPIDSEYYQGMDVYTEKGIISKIIWYKLID